MNRKLTNITSKKKHTASSTQSRRLQTALLAIVCITTTCALLICVMGHSMRSTADAAAGECNTKDTAINGTYTQSIWEAMKNGETITDAAASQGITVARSSNELPEWFEGEILTLSNINIFSNADSTIVSFTSSQIANAALQDLTSSLSTKGWITCGDISVEATSMVKKEGVCKWLMMECIDLGSETSVVLHIRRD